MSENSSNPSGHDPFQPRKSSESSAQFNQRLEHAQTKPAQQSAGSPAESAQSYSGYDAPDANVETGQQSPYAQQPPHGQQPYGQEQYGYQQPQAYGYAPVTNGLAIAALVTGILGMGIIPVIFGHIALRQIRDRGDQGRGMAIAGLILGYLGIVVYIVAIIFFIMAAIALNSL